MEARAKLLARSGSRCGDRIARLLPVAQWVDGWRDKIFEAGRDDGLMGAQCVGQEKERAEGQGTEGGGVEWKFNVRLGKALREQRSCLIREEAPEDDIGVWREAPTSSDWQEKDGQQIAKMLKMACCQTAGAGQLGGSWGPMHRAPRMTSRGF